MNTTLAFLNAYFTARFSNSDRGATMVEYALMLGLIAVVCIVAVGVIGTEGNRLFDFIGDELTGVPTP
jgi:pilus assembly protein Flp/PilA